VPGPSALAIWLCLALTLVVAGPVRVQAQADAELRDEILGGQDPVLVGKARAGDPYAQLALGTKLANIFQDASLREAIFWLESAYAQFDAMTGDVRKNAGEAAWTVGYAYKDLSDFDAALVWFGRVKSNAEELSHLEESEWRIASALQLQGLTLIDLSRYPEALAKLEAARAIFAGGNAKGRHFGVDIASTWLHAGIALEGQKRYEEAIDAYHMAMDGFERAVGREEGGYGYAVGNIGVVYWRMGRFELARDWMEVGLQFDLVSDGDFTLNTTKSRINLGLVSLDLGDADTAIYWSMQALPWMVANRRQSLSDQRWVFETLQRAFAQKGQIDRAILFGKMAVNAQQEIRALNDTLSERETEGLRSEWRRLYEDLADLLVSQGRISEAQAVLNMEKEQEVFDYLRRDGSADLRRTQALLSDDELDAQAKLTALAGIPVAAEQELRRLQALDDSGTANDAERDAIAVLEEAVQQASEQFDTAVEAFLAEVPTETRGSFETQFDSVGSYQDILAGLERPTAILQIAALGDATHIFLTLAGVARHHEVAVGRAELAKLVFDALQAIEDRDPGVKGPLKALDDILIAPVRDELQAAGIEVLMLNLDGFLRYVPFAALHDGDRYLVEDYALALYSAAVPTQFRRSDRDSTRTAGFGVTRAYPGFDALPGVRLEMERIFGAGGSLAGQTGLDEGFDEASLKKSLRGKPEILHIASHFALQPGQEDDSFLLLGDGAHLTLASIRKERALRFQGVDLLTLSACQTARGGDGSELDGFGATAQLSGASAVMASLWPVADEATPRLMAAFYRGMVVEGLDKAEALRQAQLGMLAGAGGGGEGASRGGKPLRRGGTPAKVGLDHPYYWSAFVLMGNWL
jgi:CHAT domain-containing protein/tetratricopeptide (TPR) repeat protein